MLNDIAMLKLTEKVTLSNYIKVACLPLSNYSFPSYNQKSYAAGWVRENEKI